MGADADAAATREATGRIDFQADLSLPGFCHFYAKEFVWGEDVVSVRLGEVRKASEFPKLKKEYPYMPADEAKYMLHIEDLIDVERNLNCVLNPGSVYKLWDALHAEAAKSAKERKPRTPAQEVARQTRAEKRAEKSSAPAQNMAWKPTLRVQ